MGNLDLESSGPLQVWHLQLWLGLNREGVDVLHGDRFKASLGRQDGLFRCRTFEIVGGVMRGQEGCLRDWGRSAVVCVCVCECE